MQRDNFQCVACGDKSSTLHVHHMKYCGKPWASPLGDLQTLCEQCHSRLGEHPKAGVFWWKGGQDGRPVVGIWWCPKCKGGVFIEKDSWHKCAKCLAWDTNSYTDCGYVLEQGLTVIEEPAIVAAKPRSMSWIKGVISKARVAGATEEQIWEAVFPGRQFPRGLFCAPQVGEWTTGASADAAVTKAAELAGGLAQDFVSLGTAKVFGSDVIELKFPANARSAVEFLSRREVRSSLEDSLQEVCGRRVTIEFVVSSRFETCEK